MGPEARFQTRRHGGILTGTSLAQSYLRKALARLRVLDILIEGNDFSDVVREAQEAVELALKGMLRQVGIEPPKWHDVGEVILQESDRFSQSIRPDLQRLAEVSAWLREERELSFYGDVDFIPTEEYTRADALKARDDARFTVNVARRAIPDEGSQR